MAGAIPLSLFEPIIQQRLSEGETYTIWCRRLDWTTVKSGEIFPDISRIKRLIGHSAYMPGGRKQTYIKTGICNRSALNLCKALNIDPVDIGL